VTSSATPTPNPVVCADADALRASLDKLAQVTVGAGTAEEIKADLEKVRADLTTLAKDSRGERQDETNALTSALTALQTAVDDLVATPSTSAISAVATALGEVGTAAQDLLAAVSTRCPSVSPSPSG